MTKILITSPSLDAKQNVSGISSLISDILSNSKSDITHFLIGRKDGEKKNALWLVKVVINYVQFVWLSISRGYKIIHINSSMESPAIARDLIFSLIAKKLFNKKVLLHIHGGFYLMNRPTKSLFLMIRALFESADAIVVLSAQEKDILSDRYGIYNFHIFPNAVDTVLLKEPNKESEKKNKKVDFIFLGSINKAKGIFIISECFKYLNGYFDSFSFNIYGKGPDLEEWLISLSQYPELNYNYNGVIKGLEKWKMLSAADVFLLPSFHEGLPMAMLEAMAAECLVVVTDDATMTTVVSHNVNGIIIPKNNPEHLANQIKDIIDERINRVEIAKNARIYVNNNLSFSTYINNLDELYLKI